MKLLRLAVNVIAEKQEFHTKWHHPVSTDLRLLLPFLCAGGKRVKKPIKRQSLIFNVFVIVATFFFVIKKPKQRQIHLNIIDYRSHKAEHLILKQNSCFNPTSTAVYFFNGNSNKLLPVNNVTCCLGSSIFHSSAIPFLQSNPAGCAAEKIPFSIFCSLFSLQNF